MESYLRRLPLELEKATARASDEAFHKGPPGKWNSAQILEHLYLSYTSTNKRIAQCLKGGRPLATGATLKHRMRNLLVIGLGYMPEGVKAPQVVVPGGLPLEEVRKNIFSEIEKMAAGLDECERRFGARTMIMNHPILGPLTANQWRKLHWVHGRHHARQIRKRILL
jgi:hypothetical protein